MHGDPGVGKTALLDEACAAPAGMQVLRVDGYEAESTIPFAALQRSFIPLGKYLSSLPERHQRALLVASGAADGPPPDRFLVGLGLLGLLAASAQDRPVVCAVDDAHHLDPESLEVLAFVARRLEAEPVALLFAGRIEEGLEDRILGVPMLRLEGLSAQQAVRLLAESLPSPIDPAAAARIAAATGGNPLALIDLARGLSVSQLSEMSMGEEPVPVGHHLEAHYVRRVRDESSEVQDWLLVAAADSTGNITLIRDAATRLGLGVDAADRAERAGLIELADLARFRHPLVRAAVYNAASGTDRRRAHFALAQAADALDLVELEAWHAAKATLGTDPDVADRLEHAADLAGRRGGFLSRAAVLSRAADLTPPGAERNLRIIDAAEAALQAGAAEISRTLLEQLSDDAEVPVLRGRILVLRAALAMFVGEGEPLLRGTATLLEAADLFHGRASELEQGALTSAYEFYVNSDRLTLGVTLPDLADRIGEGASLAEGPRAVIVKGISALVGRSYDQAFPAVRDAVAALGQLPDEELMQRGAAIASMATYTWDLEARRTLLGRAATGAREAGALRNLDILLWVMAFSELTGGTVQAAEQYNEQVRELRRALGYDAEIVVNGSLLAWQGADRDLVQHIADGAAAMGYGGVAAGCIAALAIRDLADAQYEDAYARLKPHIDDPFLQVTPTQYPDFVEAAARSGRQEDAANIADYLSWMADVNGSAWCRGLAERCLALVASDDAAEAHYRSAVKSLESTGAHSDRGRTHLLYGEWLRRVKRRREARAELYAAMDSFARSGTDIFTIRTTSELEATGTGAGYRTQRQHFDLTPQELTVARLAASGQTNREMGSTLFISPNTVDYHLRKVFQKLGISSRRQLADKLTPTDEPLL